MKLLFSEEASLCYFLQIDYHDSEAGKANDKKDFRNIILILWAKVVLRYIVPLFNPWQLTSHFDFTHSLGVLSHFPVRLAELYHVQFSREGIVAREVQA